MSQLRGFSANRRPRASRRALKKALGDRDEVLQGGWPLPRAKTYFPEKRAAIAVVSLRKSHKVAVSSTNNNNITQVSIGQVIVWILVGGFAGALAGRVVTLKKEGLGRWMNFLVGIVGALLGGELFKLLRIDFGLGDLKVTFEDLIAAFVGSLLVIFVWRIIMKTRAKKVDKD
jgi:uncharacterized membrane protein YeaQ/YmgE (transglycosylase-associated protein family)